MVQVATIGKNFLKTPATFWVSLFVSSAAVTCINCLPLQAKVDKFQGTVARYSVLQNAAPVETLAEAPMLAYVSSLAELTLDKKHIDIHKVQGSEATPPTTTLEANPVEVLAETPKLSDVPSRVDRSSNAENIDTNDPMSQVTNTSQLRDVASGDWAYEALRSLVERYGCIAGYSDGTFQGNRATSRFEFAAGLNACLQQIEKLIAANSADFVSKQDLATLQRLTDEFKTELATLGTRTDKLEGRTAHLEEHQFSPTTRLNGLAWFNLTGAFSGGDVKVETTDLNGINGDIALRQPGRENGKPAVRIAKNNPNITLSNLVWLTLETSFTGKDSLVTQLAVGNGNSPANVFASAGLFNTFGTPFLDQTAGTQTGVNQIVLRELAYRFPVTKNIQLVVGPRINWNRYFDDNVFTFFLTGASSLNSNGIPMLTPTDRGAGAVVLWDISKKLKLHVSYLGESNEYLSGSLFNSASNPREGLFNGTNSITSELTFSPRENINLRFIYQRSNIKQINGLIGTPIGGPIYGFADDGFGGSLHSATADVFGFNFDWRITSRLGIFGRYAYGSAHLTPVDSTRPSGDVKAQSLQIGVAFPDLGKQGALATLSYVRPYSVLDGRNFLVSGGGDGGVQYEFEATYFYPLTNNIALVPAFYLIGNPNNFSDNFNIYVGNIRAQLSF